MSSVAVQTACCGGIVNSRFDYGGDDVCQSKNGAVSSALSNRAGKVFVPDLQRNGQQMTETNPTDTAVAKTGDSVRIHYTGTLSDESVFDSSEGREPLEFTLGSGMVIKGFDDGVTGMAVGEKKTVNIPCVDAYGVINPEMMQDVPREQIPAEIPLEVGLQLQMQAPDGHVMPVTVVKITEESVTLDANHALAGKDLTFALELVSIS
mgnify:CR=1 FL=1